MIGLPPRAILLVGMFLVTDAFAFSPFLGISQKNVEGGISWDHATVSVGTAIRASDAFRSNHVELRYDVSLYYLQFETGGFRTALGADYHALTVIEGGKGHADNEPEWGFLKLDVAHELVGRLSGYATVTPMVGTTDYIEMGTLDMKVGFRYRW